MMKGEGWNLIILEKRAWRQENESVAMRNLFGVKDENVRRALIIAKHSEV